MLSPFGHDLVVQVFIEVEFIHESVDETSEFLIVTLHLRNSITVFGDLIIHSHGITSLLATCFLNK